MSEHWQKVPGLITRLYEITDELERMFGRKFTPDGHLVGSLGEAIAVYMYELELSDPSFKTHDAKTKDGKRMVQVKFTAGKSFGIYAQPDYLIALRLANRNEIVEVFSGPGGVAWADPAAGPRVGTLGVTASGLHRRPDDPAPHIVTASERRGAKVTYGDRGPRPGLPIRCGFLRGDGDAAVGRLIPALSCRSCRPHAPFAELVRLSRTSIADEVREERKRRRMPTRDY